MCAFFRNRESELALTEHGPARGWVHVTRAHDASARHWRRLPRSRQASPVCCLPTHSVTRYSRAQLPICQSTRIPGNPNPNRIRGINMTLITLRTRPTTGPAPPAACCLPARVLKTAPDPGEYRRTEERPVGCSQNTRASWSGCSRMRATQQRRISTYDAAASRRARCTRCTYMGASAVWALRGLNVRSSAISRRVKH